MTIPQVDFFTAVDSHYLTRLLALHESLLRYSEVPFRLFAYCLDEASGRILNRLRPEGVLAIPIGDLERSDPDLLATRRTRTTAEYSWTAKPSMAWDVLERRSSADHVAYVDSDMAFYDDPRRLFPEWSATQYLTPHRFSAHYVHLSQRGLFNAGYVGLRRSGQASRAISWWRERCLEWCYRRPWGRLFADQAYLDDWPTRFEGTAILDDPGANVGPWNWTGLALRPGGADGDRPLLEGRPVALAHYHGLRLRSSGAVEWRPIGYLTDGPQAGVLLRPYAPALERALWRVRSVEPDFASGLDETAPLGARAFSLAARSVNRVCRRFPALSALRLRLHAARPRRSGSDPDGSAPE